jgi:hypothetical protein
VKRYWRRIGTWLFPIALSLTGFHSSWGQASNEKVFAELLLEYRNHPRLLEALKGEEKAYEAADPQLLSRLSPAVREARFKEFNPKFLEYRQLQARLKTQTVELEKRLEKIPLSDFQKRGELEVKLTAQRDRANQAGRLLFMLSVNANESFLSALSTLPADRRRVQVASNAAVSGAPVPKLPGVFGGSAEERQRALEADKINLTPVDPEFYASQLGKKLESDLGGKAQAWSYDYDRDELYVVVNGQIGKLRVRAENGGARFIQTRVGTNYVEPRGSDTRVDMLTARGRFLTGDGKEESLFGAFPDTRPVVVDESKIHKGKGSSTHHDHDH